VHLRELDAKIAAETKDPSTFNIGRRIAYLRHRAAHGHSIGVESDGLFYSLLMIVLILSGPSL